VESDTSRFTSASDTDSRRDEANGNERNVMDSSVVAQKNNKESTAKWLLLWWPKLAAISISVAFLLAVFDVLLTINDTPLTK
jgi:hypothetical protein